MENIIITEINRIIYVGKDEYPERKIQFHSKKLTYCELIYQSSGEATVYFNNQILHPKPNTIRFLPAGPYEKYVVERIKHEDCIDIFFSSNIPLSDCAFVIDAKNEKLAPLFKKAFLLWVRKDSGFYMECISILYKILAEMQKMNYLPPSQFEKIKPAIEYIDKHFLTNENITSKKLETLCGISYSYIKRIFIKKFKVSPKRYIVQLKMNYACDLLYLNQHTVSQIAELCGYSDIYTFSRQFKLEFGVSPSNFVKKYKSSK